MDLSGTLAPRVYPPALPVTLSGCFVLCTCDVIVSFWCAVSPRIRTTSELKYRHEFARVQRSALNLPPHVQIHVLIFVHTILSVLGSDLEELRQR